MKRKSPWVTASNPPLPFKDWSPSDTKFVAYMLPGDKQLRIGTGFVIWDDEDRSFIWCIFDTEHGEVSKNSKIVVHWWLDVKMPGKNYALLKKLKKGK